MYRARHWLTVSTAAIRDVHTKSVYITLGYKATLNSQQLDWCTSGKPNAAFAKLGNKLFLTETTRMCPLMYMLQDLHSICLDLSPEIEC